jgi:predicted O-methyltransferase YrrM
MKSLQELCKDLEAIPYMNYQQAGIIRNLIIENNYRDAIELGFFHGKSSVFIASIFEKIGAGHLTTFDVKSAEQRTPNILQLLANYNLSHRVTPVFCDRSFTWELAKLIQINKKPIFDFCYLDGGHTLDPTGLAFFLIDMLLKPGGRIVFDDLNWTISTSPAYQSALKEGKDTYSRFSEEEKNTPAVKLVFEQFAAGRGYTCSELTEVDWGIAVKNK